MIVIGNDVWIGNDVTLISDVVIGNGAVIGTGSVVTHDIPPYTIYAGNPAVYIRDRFPTHIISGLQQISWWNFSRNKIKEIENDMKGDVEAFVSKYELSGTDRRVKDRATIFGFNTEIIMLTFLDIESDYPVFCEIMDQFNNKKFDKNIALVICYHSNNNKESSIIDSLSALTAESNYSSDVHICGISEEDEESLICNSDFLILGRDIKNIARISFALKYGTKILSGVSKPILF